MLYKIRPNNFQPDLRVVGCFLEHRGKILMLKRSADKTQGGKWGVPAGKVEQDEAPEKAMVREILEETGLVIEPDWMRYIDTAHVEHQEGQEIRCFDYIMFHVILPHEQPPRINLMNEEHSDLRWIPPGDSARMENIVEDHDDTIAIFLESQAIQSQE